MQRLIAFVAVAVILLAGGGIVHEMLTNGPPPVVSPAPSPSANNANPIRLLELGSDSCPPCRALEPILEDLERDYRGRVVFEQIDVWKNPEEGRKYGVRAIPTLIYYDAKGQEVERQVGFREREAIEEVFQDMGVR